MTEARKNKYSDQWFRGEAQRLRIDTDHALFERMLAEKKPSPVQKALGMRLGWAAAFTLLVISAFAYYTLPELTKAAPVVIELSDNSSDQFYSSYGEFLRSDKYVQLEKAYRKIN